MTSGYVLMTVAGLGFVLITVLMTPPMPRHSLTNPNGPLEPPPTWNVQQAASQQYIRSQKLHRATRFNTFTIIVGDRGQGWFV